MQLIDERGRLLGKVNLIDAIVAVFVLLLIPLAYGAFVLFRVPAPTISAIEPTTVTQGEMATLTITGRDLRPFLRARLGTTESLGFLVESPTRAEVKLPALTAGAHDLALYDQGQELLRIPDAVTVVPTVVPVVVPGGPAGPRTEVQVVGAFVGLAKEEARLIRVGLTLGTRAEPVAEVMAVGEAEPRQQRLRVGTDTIVTPVTSGELQKAALLRLTCLVVDEECRVGGRAVVRNATVALPVAVHSDHELADGTRLQQLRFSVEDVHPANIAVALPVARRVEMRTRVATIRARFLVRPEVMSLVAVGDVDSGGSTGGVNVRGAQLTGIDPNRETLTALTTVTDLDKGVRRTYDVQQPVTAFTATLRVPVVLTATGWRYGERPIKVGAAISFETISYFMDGSILDVGFGPDSTRESR